MALCLGMPLVVSPGVALAQPPLDGLAAPPQARHFVHWHARADVGRAVEEGRRLAEASSRLPWWTGAPLDARDALHAIAAAIEARSCGPAVEARWIELRPRLEGIGPRHAAAAAFVDGELARCRGQWGDLVAHRQRAVRDSTRWCSAALQGLRASSGLLPHCVPGGGGQERRLEQAPVRGRETLLEPHVVVAAEQRRDHVLALERGLEESVASGRSAEAHKAWSALRGEGYPRTEEEGARCVEGVGAARPYWRERCFWAWYEAAADRELRAISWDGWLRVAVRALNDAEPWGADAMLYALEVRYGAALSNVERARLTYWRARAAQGVGRARAAAALDDEAWRSAPLSYHGMLAARNLGRTKTDWLEVGERAMHPVVGVALDPPLVAEVLSARELVALGFFGTAEALLRESYRGSSDAPRVREAVARELAWLLGERGRAREAAYWASGPGAFAGLDREGFVAWHPFLLRHAYPVLYREAWEPAARARAVDVAWMPALIRRETGFRPTAISYAGARGLMQVMPSTLHWLEGRGRLTGGLVMADLLDARKNALVGAAAIAALRDVVGEDEAELMAAAYNTGIGRVRRWERSLRVDDARLRGPLFLEFAERSSVRAYVRDVVVARAVYALLLDPDLP
mgnify:CR=1 FL=1